MEEVYALIEQTENFSFMWIQRKKKENETPVICEQFYFCKLEVVMTRIPRDISLTVLNSNNNRDK